MDDTPIWRAGTEVTIWHEGKLMDRRVVTKAEEIAGSLDFYGPPYESLAGKQVTFSFTDDWWQDETMNEA